MSLMKIEELFHFEKGILQSSKYTAGKFNFITAASEWKTHNEYTHDCEALIFAAAASGSLGRTHYVNGKFVSSDLCFIITAKNQKKFPIDLKFYHMIFNEFKNDIVNSTKAGTSKEAISKKAFGNYKLPYFRIDKQIETKVQFASIQKSKIELNIELTNQLDLIKQLRQAFLREAMQGKLVKSTNTKETGQQLLEKIKAEKTQLIKEKKLKKEKEFPAITNDEIPFEIPKHWTWCRLGDVCYTSGRIGWKGLSAAEYQKTGPLFLSVHSLNYGDYVDYSKAFHITKERYNESPEIMLQNEDILICKDGAGIGKLGIIENLNEPATINSSLLLIRKDQKLNTKFVYFFFLSSHFQKIVTERIMGATTPHLYQRDIINFPFALPPVHEQNQIVNKLDELMKFCDDLEQGIKESQDYNEMLLQQVLREALQPKEETVSTETLFDSTNYDLFVAMMQKQIEKEFNLNYGEVAIQKTVFHINTFTDFKFGYPFKNSNYGTYSYQLRDDLAKNSYLTKITRGNGKVFSIQKAKEKEVLEALSNPENTNFITAINRVLKIYAHPFINKETEKIELLNTVSKMILDLQTTDLEIIYKGMQNWEIDQKDFKTKADKFSKANTKKMIEIISEFKLIVKLIKNNN